MRKYRVYSRCLSQKQAFYAWGCKFNMDSCQCLSSFPLAQSRSIIEPGAALEVRIAEQRVTVLLAALLQRVNAVVRLVPCPVLIIDRIGLAS